MLVVPSLIGASDLVKTQKETFFKALVCFFWVFFFFLYFYNWNHCVHPCQFQTILSLFKTVTKIKMLNLE